VFALLLACSVVAGVVDDVPGASVDAVDPAAVDPAAVDPVAADAAAADPADPVGDVDGAAADAAEPPPLVEAPQPSRRAARREPPDDGPPPFWVYAGVGAGVSFAGSIVSAVVGAAALIFPAGTLASISLVLLAAPISAGYVVSTLTEHDGAAPIVGLVVGDVVGAFGGIAVALVAANRWILTLDASTECEECFLSEQVVASLGVAVLGAWVGRAVGSGVGAALGSLLPAPHEGQPVY
jgi:hypothetical protein